MTVERPRTVGRPRAVCDHAPAPCQIVTYRKLGRWYSTCRTRATMYERKRLGIRPPTIKGQRVHDLLIADPERSDSSIGRELGLDRSTVLYHRRRSCRCDGQLRLAL